MSICPRARAQGDCHVTDRRRPLRHVSRRRKRRPAAVLRGLHQTGRPRLLRQQRRRAQPLCLRRRPTLRSRLRQGRHGRHSRRRPVRPGLRDCRRLHRRRPERIDHRHAGGRRRGRLYRLAVRRAVGHRTPGAQARRSCPRGSPRSAAGLLLALHTDPTRETLACQVLRAANGHDVEHAEGVWRDNRWQDFDPLKPPQREP